MVTFIRPDQKKHREQIFDLTGKAFSNWGYWDWIAYCHNGYFDHSHYDWDASTVGIVNNKVVTHWGVWGYGMRIGSVVVRVAGIGAVATDGTLRKRGLMRKTAENGLKAIKKAGYDLTLLYGIENFYHKYGYVAAWPRQIYTVKTCDLPGRANRAKLSEFSLKHRQDLAQIYNCQNAGLTGTAVRPTYGKHPQPWQGYFWKNSDKTPAGYIIVDTRNGKFSHIESAGRTKRILGNLRQLAKRHSADKVLFPDLHYQSELARELRRSNCRLETEYFKSGQAMVRTLSLKSILNKMSDELSARLKGSHLRDWQGRLSISDVREEVTLEIDRAKVIQGNEKNSENSISGGKEIARLLIGSDTPEEIVKTGNMKLSGQAEEMLPIIFPHCHPMLPAWDIF